MYESELILSVGGLPPMSARGCYQSLTPVVNGEFKRTVNGNLVYLSQSKDQKYKSTIKSKDVNSLALDNLWVGGDVNIGCIHMLWHTIAEGKQEITLCRPPVKGSVLAVNKSGQPVDINVEEQTIKLKSQATEQIFIGFRPWLSMKVLNIGLETDEWDIKCGWNLTLEEI